MLCIVSSNLRNLHTTRKLCVKIVDNHLRQRLFSAKRPIQPVIQKSIESDQKKPKTQPVPRITLIASDNNINVMTIEEAKQLSKRRDLKLIKINDFDTKTGRPVYKLMTGAEYHAEELKQRELRKIEKSNSAIKGEKLLMLNCNISKHDLDINIKKILKWIAKNYEVRVTINGDASNMEKSEIIYKSMEDCLKEQVRFLQKRTKGSDLKFQLIPPKNKGNETKSL